MKAKMQPLRAMQFGFSAALAVLFDVGMVLYPILIDSIVLRTLNALPARTNPGDFGISR
jgi:hypothetical protein